MQRNKVLAYLGLATRAGKSVSGEFSVEKSVRQHRAKLVIVSEDASENSKKKFSQYLYLLWGAAVFSWKQRRTGIGLRKRSSGIRSHRG